MSDLASAAPYLRALLSVDPGQDDVRAMSPAQRRGETFEALRRLLVRAAERRPQVLVIEDLHWIDSASEQFLAMLVDTVPALRALLVFTYRPGYVHSFGERSYVTRVVPAALSAEDSARMVAAVLATDALPDELRGLVGGKAEGNPFYVEELVKSLEESGALRRVGTRYELARPSARSPFPARSRTSSRRGSTVSPRRPSARSSSPRSSAASSRGASSTASPRSASGPRSSCAS